MIFHLTGFYDGPTSFGLYKKGNIHTASDFNFDIIAEVICAVPASSGYLVRLTPQGHDSATRCSVYLIVGVAIIDSLHGLKHCWTAWTT